MWNARETKYKVGETVEREGTPLKNEERLNPLVGDKAFY